MKFPRFVPPRREKPVHDIARYALSFRLVFSRCAHSLTPSIGQERVGSPRPNCQRRLLAVLRASFFFANRKRFCARSRSRLRRANHCE